MDNFYYKESKIHFFVFKGIAIAIPKIYSSKTSYIWQRTSVSKVTCTLASTNSFKPRSPKAHIAMIKAHKNET